MPGQSRRDAAGNLYRSTVRNFRPNGEQGASRKRGRPSQTAAISMFLLHEPMEKVPPERERKIITQRGLGAPKADKSNVFQRNWNIDQVFEHICSVYQGHPLALTGFDLARASKNKVLSKLKFDSVKQLKASVGRGRLYIVPKRRLPNLEDIWAELEDAQGQELQDLGSVEVTSADDTHSRQPQTPRNIEGETEQAIGGEDETEQATAGEDESEQAIGGDDETEQEIGGEDETEQAIGGEAETEQAIGGEDETEQATEGEDETEQAAEAESMPQTSVNSEVETERTAVPENMAVNDSRRLSLNINRRLARTAGSAARQRIRRWVHNLTRGNTGETAESPMIIGDDDTSASTADSITGAAVDNQGFTLHELRQQQDDAYYASLRADQEKERQRQQERHQNEELQKLRIQLQQMRGRNLPAEPDPDGRCSFILKIRGGSQRRFRASDQVKVLINFVGSVEEASIDFIIKMAGTDIKIHSWFQGEETLEQLGINCSAVLEVDWKEDTSNDSLDAYEALMGMLDTDPEMLNHEEENLDEFEVAEPNSPGHESLNVVLTMWRSSTLQDENEGYQSITVTRQPKSLWEHALRCYERGSFNLKKVLKVTFRNEPGQDEGGLRREFFDTLQRQMLMSSLLEGAGQEHDTTCDMVAFVEKRYMTLGKMVASMLIQGGPLQPIFSHMLVAYGIGGGLEAATIEMLDEEKRALVERVQTAPLHVLQGDELILDAMSEAGMRCLLTDQNRLSICKALILRYSRLNERQIFMEQFWEGAELGLRTLLRANKGVVEPLLCGRCGELPKTTADGLVNLLEVDTHGEANSNSRRLSEEVAQNFESFIYDCEDGKCDDLTVGQILKFLSGCSTLPPGGLGKKISVHFTSDQRYPSVWKCTLDMTLPLNLHVYAQFKNVMAEAIVSGQGFGNV